MRHNEIRCNKKKLINRNEEVWRIEIKNVKQRARISNEWVNKLTRNKKKIRTYYDSYDKIIRIFDRERQQNYTYIQVHILCAKRAKEISVFSLKILLNYGHYISAYRMFKLCIFYFALNVTFALIAMHNLMIECVTVANTISQRGRPNNSFWFVTDCPYIGIFQAMPFFSQWNWPLLLACVKQTMRQMMNNN